MRHDIKELIKKLSNGFLIDVEKEAVDDIRVFRENVWDKLLLLSAY